MKILSYVLCYDRYIYYFPNQFVHLTSTKNHCTVNISNYSLIYTVNKVKNTSHQ